MRYKSRSRALAASALAASLGLAGLGLVAPAAGAAPAETDRIAGQDRYETAADIAAEALPGADTVVLTTGERLPDALSANPIAGAEDAPILLTRTNSIPASTQAQLDAIDPTNVIIVGGTSAVSNAVENELEGDGYVVTREAGADRFETAAEVALAVGEAPVIDADGVGSQTGLRTVALANGLTGLPDAVAASPMLHQEEIPLLLTGPDTLNDDAAAAIAALDAEQVLVLGGTAAISNAIEDELEGDDINVERLAGTDRWGTAAAIADFEIDFLGFDASTTYIASGFSLADALAGGPLASVTNGPIVLVSETSVPAPTARWIEDNAADIDEIIALGGTAVINDSVLDEAAELADEDGTTTGQAFTVAGNTEGRDLGVDGARTCTVTGITPGSTVDVALFPSEDVRIAPNGTITFTDAAPADNLADNEGNTAASISNINGTPTNGADEQNNVVSPTGSLSVTLSSAAADDVTLVVFQDQAGFTADSLDLVVPAVANNQPKAARESFGIGCRTLFANEAAGGMFGAVTVASTDKAANLFTANDRNYFYDANDQYQVNGVPQAAGQAGMDAFEARLSPGDTVSGTYATDAAGVSTFNLTDAAPVAPATATATASGTTVTLQFAESATPTADSYNVYRAVRPASATTCPDFNTAGSTGRGQYPAAPTTTVADPTPSAAGGTTLTVTDTGLAPNTTYCYVVTTVDEGDESNTGRTATTGGVTDGVTTSTVGTAPTIQDVRASDAGTIGLVDAGDLHQFIFSEPMAATIDDAGQLYRIQDADGSVAEVVCGTNANCTLQGAGTFNGTAYPAGQVLRVTITGPVSAITGFLGTVPGLQYPVTITNVSAGWDDAAGNQLNLAGSPDRVINVDTITPAGGAADTTAPDVTSATASQAARTVTLTYSEPVDCSDNTNAERAAAAAAFGYSDGDDTDVAPTSITCNGTTTVVLTFANNIIQTVDGAANINYTDEAPAADANDILDLSGNQALSPETNTVAVGA